MVKPGRDNIPVASAVTLKDGRRLAYCVLGKQDGNNTLLWFHGTPSCRLEAEELDASAITDLGLRVIAVDRPGYGQSDPHPHRTFASFSDDVVQLAGKLQLGRVLVAGMSGGVPYALALAHYAPHLIRGLLLNCGAGSVDALTPEERREVQANLHTYPSPGLIRLMSSASLAARCVRAVLRSRLGAAIVFWLILKPVYENCLGKRGAMSYNDKQCMLKHHPAFQTRVIPETLRQKTAAPWVEDLLLLFNPWSFTISNTDPSLAAATIINHGMDDSLLPPVFSRALHRMLPAAHLILIPGGGHADFWWCNPSFQRETFAALLEAARC